jgi:protein TonB
VLGALAAVSALGLGGVRPDEIVLPALMGRIGSATAEAEGASGGIAVRIAPRPRRTAPEALRARPPLVSGAEPEPGAAPLAAPFDDRGALPAPVAIDPAQPRPVVSAARAPLTILLATARPYRGAVAPRAGAARGPAAAPPAPAPARPGDGDPAAAASPGFASVRAADLPPPVYPHPCLLLGHEGLVLIEVRVGADGRVLEARVAQASACPDLDAAALAAVRAARYVPGRRNGAPIAMTILQPIRFELPREADGARPGAATIGRRGR